MIGDFIFTPENLIENIHLLGPWSAFGMAETALKHYHKYLQFYNGDPLKQMEQYQKVMNREDLNSWQAWIIRYHKEIGYPESHFNPICVNER